MDPGRKPVKAPAPKPAVAVTKTPRANGGFLAFLNKPTDQTLGTLRFILLAETMAMLVLACVLVYAFFNIPRDPIPFSVNTKTGQPARLVALQSATKTQQAILSWVGSASADILNFGFHNVYDRLQSTEKYFTEDGWESFVEAIKSSNIIERITQKQQVITAAPVGTPVIVSSKENLQYGREWTVQVPISVTVLSGKDTDSKRRTLTLVLVTVPPDKNLTGLGIDRWVETN